MTIAELKQLIENVPDDFDFEVNVGRRRNEAELKESPYPYPFDFERCSTDNQEYDIGWSEKKMMIDVMVPFTIQSERDMEHIRGHWPETMGRAVANWGSAMQTDKAIEEMGELIRAIMKYRHKPISQETTNNLLEEIADVELVLAQLKRLFDPDNEIESIKVFKMDRLKKILDDGGHY